MISNMTKYDDLLTSSIRKDKKISNLKYVIYKLLSKDKNQMTAKELFHILVDGMEIEGIQPRKTKEYYMDCINYLLSDDEWWR